MCGIAGAVNFKLSHNNIQEHMGHRGPDDRAGFSEDNVSFYFLRLAIVDIKSGKQPMQLAGKKFTIIFNGEIYNHKELRKIHNLTGNTSSDTETLLLLFDKYGTSMLQYLEGMFAFAIYDHAEKKIFIARDRAGKKPLYYYKDNEKIVFASELNCLAHLLPLEMNRENFYSYLRLGSFYKSCTPYRNVKELPAASYLLINCQTLDITQKKWWDINDYYSRSNTDSFEKALETVDSSLHAAVKRRIESSDLDVGSFLSGGIDSGLVTAIASEYNKNLKTFTVSFNGAYDEAPLAKQVADKYGTQHTEININFDHLQADLEKILTNYGEPFFDSSAIPSYYVSEAAKKYVTVVLNGDGADELFGGYRRYIPFSKYDFFNANKAVKISASFLKKILPHSQDKKSKYNYLYRLLSFASASDLEIYLSAGVDIMEGYEKNILGSHDYLAPVRHDVASITRQDISGLKKLMNIDFNINLFNDLLVKMDIATMAHSMEGRSPFLCKELMEYAPSMQDRYKINGTTTKYLLRTLAKKYLPPDLINQPKRGFEIPLKSWVNGQLKDIIHDYLNSGSSLHHEFVHKDFTQKLLAGKISMPAEKRAKIIWTLFAMEVWYKKAYLNRP